MFDAFVPFSLAAFPAAFFIAYGRPNHERSSPPFLTVLLLVTGEHLEEVGEEKNERAGPLGWVGTPGVFFFVLGDGSTFLPSFASASWIS